MKETFYKYTIYVVFSITVLFSAFLLISDNVSPFTTQAALHRTIANIAPEVSGVVSKVMVKNGQQVSKGEALFSIDPSSYQLKVNQAKAELKQAREADSAKWQQLASVKQTLKQRQYERQNSLHKLARNQVLQSKGLITEQTYEDSRTDDHVAQSAVEAAQAEVRRIEVELSNQDKSASIQLAEAKLASAQLDLERTTVVAQTRGVITNLQLQAGSYINQGALALFVVNESNTWLSADFNEKGMNKLIANQPVLIAFDAIPGQVFHGYITTQERAIRDTDNNSAELSNVINDTRWIREQQKIRTRIDVKDLNPSLIAGSRASVIVENGNPLIDTIGDAWIHIVALFRFAY
ncbi:HlyD family secretion protein [Vibrio sinensis]|uniref:HlyD family secretion protein n=1 Tax=Vibrio sinensis TaxID=2302434 RepID=A0A3A6Q6I1_9VIBR|nr:HlyD family secretion protein [Vibrio sinensis]RJX66218.1 HlyD family secretion protein [Vibrio sinensis]